jgi:DNA polymerase (family 10)
MSEERLLEEIADIDRANEELESSGSKMRLLRAIEMNLSPEGEGDMDPAALDMLDLVLGAFHSKLRVTDDQTERYRRAVRNPDVDVLAHPRGRRYGARLGLQADWRAVVAAAGETGTALEVDAYPDRQDLDVGILRLVAAADVWISIGTDAHSPAELRFMEYGVAAAILAEVPRERILNFLPPDGLADWVRRRRDGARRRRAR